MNPYRTRQAPSDGEYASVKPRATKPKTGTSPEKLRDLSRWLYENGIYTYWASSVSCFEDVQAVAFFFEGNGYHQKIRIDGRIFKRHTLPGDMLDAIAEMIRGGVWPLKCDMEWFQRRALRWFRR